MARKLATASRVMVLGGQELPDDVMRVLLNVTKISCVAFLGMSTEDFRSLAPVCVISPLFSMDLDCLDVAEYLADLGFSGHYIVVADDLPNPTMIIRELSASCPNASVHVIKYEKLEGLLGENRLLASK